MLYYADRTVSSTKCFYCFVVYFVLVGRRSYFMSYFLAFVFILVLNDFNV